MKKAKKLGYLTIRDRTNLLIALDHRIIDVVSKMLTVDGPNPADKRYLRYLKTLRKKL